MTVDTPADQLALCRFEATKRTNLELDKIEACKAENSFLSVRSWPRRREGGRKVLSFIIYIYDCYAPYQTQCCIHNAILRFVHPTRGLYRLI